MTIKQESNNNMKRDIAVICNEFAAMLAFTS